MEILGIGPMELILILVIAMLVFGPDKLPEIGAQLGRSMRAMRRATREFSREIEDTRKAFEEPLQEIKQPLQEAAQPLQQVRDDLRNMAPLAQSITNPQEALRQAVTRELTQTDRPPEGAPAEAAAAQAASDLAPAPETEMPAAEIQPATGDAAPVVVEGEPAAAADVAIDDSLISADPVAPAEPVATGLTLDTATRTGAGPAGEPSPPGPPPAENAGTPDSAAAEE